MTVTRVDPKSVVFTFNGMEITGFVEASFHESEAHVVARSLEQQWIDAARDARVVGAIPVRFEVCVGWFGEISAVRGIMGVPHRATGEAVQVEVMRRVPTGAPPHPRFFHRLAQELYLHELGEQFSFGGERPYDPHRPAVVKHRVLDPKSVAERDAGWKWPLAGLPAGGAQ